MQQQTSFSTLNDHLVAEIAQSVQDDQVLQAFRNVPRHTFVPSFYELLPGEKRKWRLISCEDHTEEWSETVYQNRPLITSIDRYGKPDCASSQPDVMAQMLQSLHIVRGDRVLEIGTGTGYNAALLGSLVGPENVVSIDVNGALLEDARTRIDILLGPGVTLLHADGRSLPKNSGLFDAIMVTGGHTCIEPSWIQAFLPGGRIVLNWKTRWTMVMLEASKQEKGLIGKACSYTGAFMGLHDGNGVAEHFLSYERLAWISSLDMRQPIFGDTDALFFLQFCVPSLAYQRYYKKSGEIVYVVKELHTERVVQFFPDKIQGDASLWEDIHVAYTQFEQLNKPTQTLFTVTIDEQGNMVFQYKEKHFIYRVST